MRAAARRLAGRFWIVDNAPRVASWPTSGPAAVSEGLFMTSRLPRLGDLERRTAHESVTEALREAVLGGILPAGTRLVQAELATQFGVSNTPVREAMRQLRDDKIQNGLTTLALYWLAANRARLRRKWKSAPPSAPAASAPKA